MTTEKTLKDLYCFSGFRAHAKLKTHPLNPHGQIITLDRRQKKLHAPVEQLFQGLGIEKLIWYETWMLEQPTSIFNSNTDVSTVQGAKL